MCVLLLLALLLLLMLAAPERELKVDVWCEFRSRIHRRPRRCCLYKHPVARRGCDGARRSHGAYGGWWRGARSHAATEVARALVRRDGGGAARSSHADRRLTGEGRGEGGVAGGKMMRRARRAARFHGTASAAAASRAVIRSPPPLAPSSLPQRAAPRTTVASPASSSRRGSVSSPFAPAR